MRLIDADKLREKCDSPYWCVWLSEIDDAPTVEAIPVVHGEWIAQDEGLTRFKCSVCNGKNHGGHEKFCPDCGADMRKKVE